jgi:hypothetical protein
VFGIITTPSGKHERSGLNPVMFAQSKSSAGSLNVRQVLARAARVGREPSLSLSSSARAKIYSIISVGKRQTCVQRIMHESDSRSPRLHLPLKLRLKSISRFDRNIHITGGEFRLARERPFPRPTSSFVRTQNSEQPWHPQMSSSTSSTS